jgi:hypothetical protein
MLLLDDKRLSTFLTILNTFLDILIDSVDVLHSRAALTSQKFKKKVRDSHEAGYS